MHRILMPLTVASALGGGFLQAALVADFMSATAGFRDYDDRVVGWDFTTGPTQVYLSSLAFYDDGLDGLAVPHQVGLYKTSTGALIASTTIGAGTSATLSGFFREVGLSPIALELNTTYTVAASVQALTDRFVWDDGVGGITVNDLSTHPDVATGISPARYLFGTAALGFPTNQLPGADPRNFFFGPNAGLSSVPEPTITGCLALGTLLLRRRRRSIH